jgi:hypothetical protein
MTDFLVRVASIFEPKRTAFTNNGWYSPSPFNFPFVSIWKRCELFRSTTMYCLLKPNLFECQVEYPRRSNPISRSDRFQSNPRRISSETDIFHKKTDRIRHGFCRISIGRNSARISSEFDGIWWNQGRIWSDFIACRRIPMRSGPDSDR